MSNRYACRCRWRHVCSSQGCQFSGTQVLQPSNVSSPPFRSRKLGRASTDRLSGVGGMARSAFGGADVPSCGGLTQVPDFQPMGLILQVSKVSRTSNQVLGLRNASEFICDFDIVCPWDFPQLFHD